MAASDRAAFLLIEEYFATGDDRFVAALRDFHVPGQLAALVERWKKDPRPWARRQIFSYLQLPLNAPAHETVVKRLFKHAEEAGDDPLMAAFAVQFDRLVRRERTTAWRWNSQTGQTWTVECLQSPRNQIPSPTSRLHKPITRPQYQPFEPRRVRPSQRLFSYHTRCYLRRRAWRYFRRAGFKRPRLYPAIVCQMLRQYQDADLTTGENILDSWSLLHACFGESEVIEFDASHARVREGRSLSELTAAPLLPNLWKSPEVAKVLFDLTLDAQSRLVRIWSIQMLRAHHAQAFSGISIADLRRLLDHPDPDLQLLGAQLLEQIPDLGKLPLDVWLELLETRNLTALATITQLMARHVSEARLSLGECVRLATMEQTPTARLGFSFLEKKKTGAADADAIAGLADARCAAIGRELAEWALARLTPPDVYDVGRVSRFFDSLLKEVREGAWSAMTPGSPAWDDPALWSRLVETPYDDLRLRLVSALRQRSAPGVGMESLASLWAGVLLGIHRGGRHKLIALRQISDAVQEQPAAAERLLPVLAVAIRSVRLPEARAGLAAIVALIEKRPELERIVAAHLPELQLSAEGAAA